MRPGDTGSHSLPLIGGWGRGVLEGGALAEADIVEFVNLLLLTILVPLTLKM